MENGSVKGVVHGKTIVFQQDLGLPEGMEVMVTVKAPHGGMPDEILHLASQVYAGLSEQEIAEMEQEHLCRRAFFDSDKE